MKILMVCLGNICRSPLAEGILRDKCRKNDLQWKVDSAGTSNWHEGAAPHAGSQEIARINNIDIRSQRSRQFTIEDFDQFDLILAMDSDNYQNIKRLARNDSDIEKIQLILNYSNPSKNQAVPDPYYTGNFHEVFEMLEEACEIIIEQYSVN